MNADEFNAQLDELIEMMVGLYSVIGKLFELLPIPISIPALWDEDDDTPNSAVIVKALVEARAMLADLPLDYHLSALLNMAVVEWLGAFDMCALAESDLGTHGADAKAYRLGAIWLAMGRIYGLTEHATVHLRQDP